MERWRGPKREVGDVPAFKYPGGKTTLREWVAEYLPRGYRYVEPFAGRGAVFWLVASRRWYTEYWLNDIATYPWWCSILECSLAKIPPAITKDAAQLWKEQAIRGNPSARIIEPRLCYGGGVFESSSVLGCASPKRKDLCKNADYSWKHFKRTVERAKILMASVRPKLTDWEWRAVFASLKETDVVYVDPPYMGALNPEYPPLSAGEYRDMLALLGESGCSWVLSSYDRVECREILGDPVDTRQTGMRMAGKCEEWLPRVEALWTGGPNRRSPKR